MRKGFSLIEMLVMLSLFFLMMFFCAKSMKILVTDIPHLHRDFQANVSVLHMLDRLRDDIEAGKSLSKDYSDGETLKSIVMIESPKGFIGYSFDDGEIIKSILNPDGSVINDRAEVWQIKNADINWQLWQRQGKYYAIEISTGIKRKLSGHWQTKLKNSHVYFVGTKNICAEEL